MEYTKTNVSHRHQFAKTQMKNQRDKGLSQAQQDAEMKIKQVLGFSLSLHVSPIDFSTAVITVCQQRKMWGRF